MVFGHPAHGPDRAEHRDLAATPQIFEEKPARVARNEGPIDVEEGPNARHTFQDCIAQPGKNPGHRHFPSTNRRWPTMARRVVGGLTARGWRGSNEAYHAFDRRARRGEAPHRPS